MFWVAEIILEALGVELERAHFLCFNFVSRQYALFKIKMFHSTAFLISVANPLCSISNKSYSCILYEVFSSSMTTLMQHSLAHLREYSNAWRYTASTYTDFADTRFLIGSRKTQATLILTLFFTDTQFFQV